MTDDSFKPPPLAKDTFSSDSSTLHNIDVEPLKPLKPFSGRDSASGKFLPGHECLSNGRPPADKPKEFLSLSKLKSLWDEPCEYVEGQTWGHVLAKREYGQAMDDPVARKHLLDRLFGRAVESVNLNQSGEVKIVVEYEPYVKHQKQIAEESEEDNNRL